MMEDRSIIPQTSAEELAEILAAQKREVAWWKDMLVMESETDIDGAIERAEAVKVPDTGEWYRISEKVPEKFRVLGNQTFKLLIDISTRWSKKIKPSDNDVFLVVSSMARTIEYQNALAQKGYPAVKEGGTHTKLGAFDIATKWFEENDIDSLRALEEVLEELSTEGRINIIKEPTIGAYHVALNPAFEESGSK